MEFLTNEKLTIVGAAGMIGSNMAQTAMMMHLTYNRQTILRIMEERDRDSGTVQVE